MNAKRTKLFVGTLCAAVAALAQARGGGIGPRPGPGYATRCDASDPNVVKGYVTNTGTQTLQVSGVVTFAFYKDATPSRSGLRVPGSAVIPAGQTAQVAETGVPFRLDPGEECRLDVGGAVVKPAI